MDMGLEGNILKIFTHRIFDFSIFHQDAMHFLHEEGKNIKNAILRHAISIFYFQYEDTLCCV